MMQFFGVSDPTKINLPNNAMVFIENTQSVSIFYTGAALVRGRTIVMDFDRYCEYYFQGFSYGPVGIDLGDISVTKGYVFNVNKPDDYNGLFLGGGGTYPGNASGSAYGFTNKLVYTGIYTEILGGESLLAGSAGGFATYYSQIQSNWINGKANIKWYYSAKTSYNPFYQNSMV